MYHVSFPRSFHARFHVSFEYHRISQIHDFAIISVRSVPAIRGPNKNYIAQVVEIQDDGRDGFQISFLKKSYCKFIFPPDTSWVQLNEIVKILNVPVTNKRGQLIFSELKESEIKIF
jgi:hypothetical protein